MREPLPEGGGFSLFRICAISTPTSSQFWCSMRLILSILFFGLATNSHAESAPTPIPDDLDPCWAFTADATYVNHSIVMQLEHREVKMRVPIDYFEDRWDQKDGFRDTAQLFSVEIGSFLPVTRPQTAERQKRGLRSLLLILVSDHIPMEILAPREAERFIRGGNPDRPLENYVRMPGPFGLKEIESPSEQAYDQNPPEKRIYISEDSQGTPSAILNCHKPGVVLNPGCMHFFSAAGLDVQLSYDLFELPNWNRIQKDVTQFLTCATSQGL